MIDTTDPDNWEFPVGTVLYKTFLQGKLRLETRVLRKREAGTGFGVWDMRAYAWNHEQTKVTDVTTDDDCPNCAELRQNVLGTTHDIPDGTQCRECHRASVDTVNGFSAIQLNHSEALVTTSLLISEKRVSKAGTMVDDAKMPGDEMESAALGYLHANCGHCHRSHSLADETCNTPACLTGLHTFVWGGTTRVEDTPFYKTAIGRHSLFREFGASACAIG